MGLMTLNNENPNGCTIEGIHYYTGEPVTLLINNGLIEDIQSLPSQEKQTLPWVAPGLVDLQINGYNGMDFNTLPIDEGMVQRITRELWQEGVTSYYPTIITNDDESIEGAMAAISNECNQESIVEQSIAGIHLEGPFISSEDGPRGAHGRKYVKAPDWALFQRWQDAAGGRIKIVTLSPEWPGSAEFITRCVDSGVTVSIGHTDASPEQIREAVSFGARMSTHLGNGAHLMLPRHPNYIWEQLAQDELWPCIIADGFHLPEAFLKVVMKVKGSHTMLVSDAASLSGMPAGEYDLHIGGKVVLTQEGKLHLAENPKILAGSAQMLLWGIEHLVGSKLCSMVEAWEMASIRPAAFMDLPAKEGLAAGAPADVLVYRKDGDAINILKTYKGGMEVFCR